MKLSLQLQQALLAHLRADPDLTTLLHGPHVFDAPPHAASDGATLPNIVLGDESVEAWNTQDASGAEHGISFSIWSRERGYLEVKSLMAALYDALDGIALPLSEGRVVLLRFVAANTSRTAKGRLRRATCRFRALVEHAAPG